MEQREPPVTDVLRAAEENEFLGRWRVARERHEQALRSMLGGRDAKGIARGARRVARCLIEEAELDGAIDALTFARAVSAACDDGAGVAHTINLEGIVALALSEAAEIGDLAGRLRTDANRAEMYLHRRRFRTAMRISRRVLTLGLGKERCEGSWLAEAYQHLGVAYRETGEFERSEACFKQALELAERREDALVKAETLRELGKLRTPKRSQTLES